MVYVRKFKLKGPVFRRLKTMGMILVCQRDGCAHPELEELDDVVSYGQTHVKYYHKKCYEMIQV
mgnify:CR=1 FL=1